MERLQKVIANLGYCSRRKAEDLIKEGRVRVNGKTIKDLGTKVNASDMITIDNKTLTKPKLEYYLLNKPRKVISSSNDEKNRTTVVDLIDTNTRIYPIGRLDYDTTGIIILTNDGTLANQLMHPKYSVEKTYVVKLNKIIATEDFYKLKSGITIDNFKVVPTKLSIKSKNKDKNECIVEITITQGQNHVIKRMMNALGYDVLKLTRIAYGGLTLGNLKSGEYRKLTTKEVKRLYSISNL